MQDMHRPKLAATIMDHHLFHVNDCAAWGTHSLRGAGYRLGYVNGDPASSGGSHLSAWEEDCHVAPLLAM